MSFAERLGATHSFTVAERFALLGGVLVNALEEVRKELLAGRSCAFYGVSFGPFDLGGVLSL